MGEKGSESESEDRENWDVVVWHSMDGIRWEE